MYFSTFFLKEYSELPKSEKAGEEIDKAAAMLYGLIHARFLLTSRGLQLLAQKYKESEFGKCPRVSCNNHSVLPVGLSDLPGVSTLKIYCPCCKEVYNNPKAKYSHVDGAYFGRTASHLLELYQPELFPNSSPLNYVPTIYGFRIHPSAWKTNSGVDASSEPSSSNKQSANEMK